MKNRNFLTLCFFMVSTVVLGQITTLSDWKEQARKDIRLVPKYGFAQKTEKQKISDSMFVNTILANKDFKGNTTLASDTLIEKGFDYLYRGDYKTAIYRFNQAFLLDSTNSNIYWGFGGFFMSIGGYEEAKKQYLEGLRIDSTNTNILTDYGTYYMAQAQFADGPQMAERNLKLAIEQLEKSYHLDSTNQNTLFKLSVCYFQLGQCKSALHYFDECMRLGGESIPMEYKEAIEKTCKNK